MFSVMFCFVQEFYHPIHGWLAMLVCVVGTLFNLANILVEAVSASPDQLPAVLSNIELHLS